MVVCHLRANPDQKEKIIADYLQSLELLKDASSFGEFLSFWLGEFFQRQNTDRLENLLQYIKTTKPTALPRDLQKAKKEIFEPLFKLTNGEEEEIFSKVRTLGLFQVARLLGEKVISSEKQLPHSLKNQSLKYINELVRIEAGIIKPKPAKPELEPIKTRKPRSMPSILPDKNESQIKNPPQSQYSYFLLLGPNTDPTKIENLEQFSKLMGKIKGLSQGITPEKVWQRLAEFSKMTTVQIFLFLSLLFL
jgi:hypothetical protein